MNTRHFLVAALCTSLTLSGCATINQNNTTRGAAIGAAVGAIAGKATGNHKNKRLAIGAALGALTGAAVGRYMDNQEQALREQLSGTGVKVYRDGDILRLDIPAQVTFAVGRSDIRADLYPVLNDIAKVLGEYNKTMLVITGHTDDTGPMALNMQLSQSRADAVKSYLIAQQVDPIRLETRGVGPNYPAVPNTNEANRAMNRRVEIHIEPVTE
ncbi:MAG TPA: hypothetical protein DF774_09200 [Rheinheimera sp.]|uniref:OmpA family protein n=1 Tax=Rheinheimera sp. TaxID=1869214 RepID=UPI000EC7281F|nr:OmpA family protein [Rheinheimera sp.]HCU65922.1 hypothetical protein [Rheinheimera sp.]